ncbi:MAG TPA: restriction endonuclease [Blastocatellia bacterium]|nr:restriction endonuclease [Blastocatellia bacterium]
MQSESLLIFFKNLSSTEYINEASFLSTAIPQFVYLLGYDSSHLFFEREILIGSGTRFRVDAVIANSRASRPWLIIETEITRHYIRRPMADWIYWLGTYHLAIRSEYAVFLSPVALAIIQGDSLKSVQVKQYRLESISLQETEEICSLLAPPKQFPTERIAENATRAGQFIDSDTFKLDLARYSRLLEYVFSAETNDEKKESLEELAKMLMEAIPFLSCKYANLRTASSEIDLVIQFNGSKGLTFFDELGRYCLIECKNWKVSVGAAQVRDFIGKLQKSRIKLGVIFAKNGISGEHGGADAVREIHAAFDTHGLYILIVAEEELRAIEIGANFYEILDSKIDHLRFDF